jgi:pyruvate dehydrogenase E1 component alpha subunit/2-oxoisovalerate dehydrogenase E1 component alpha subunit
VIVETVPAQGAASDKSSLREDFRTAFRWMLLSRMLDEKMAALYRAGKVPGGGVYLGKGQEALSASLGMQLRKGDVFAPLIRDGAGRLAFGEPITDAFRTYFGSRQGPMRGRDGNVHRGKPREGYFPMISHLGAMISVVNGALIAKRFKGIDGAVGATCLGEGATSTGAFHEGLNQAAVEKLPLILLVADNQYAYSTPNSKQFACKSLVDKAIGYGVTGHNVDGTRLMECLPVIGKAVRDARAGGGPQLVVGRLLRLCGHGEHDDASYVDTSLKNSALGRDCLAVAEEDLLNEGWGARQEIEKWRAEAVSQIEEALGQVLREPAPDPYAEDWCAISTRRFSEGNQEQS